MVVLESYGAMDAQSCEVGKLDECLSGIATVCSGLMTQCDDWIRVNTRI